MVEVSEDANRPRRVAVVTGALGTIGSAVARLLAGQGMAIVAVDHPNANWTSADSASSVDAEWSQVPADVTQEADVRDYIEHALAAFGRIDVFFNNAGSKGRSHRHRIMTMPRSAGSSR